MCDYETVEGRGTACPCSSLKETFVETLEERIAAGEPLMRQAMDAFYRYHATG